MVTGLNSKGFKSEIHPSLHKKSTSGGFRLNSKIKYHPKTKQKQPTATAPRPTATQAGSHQATEAPTEAPTKAAATGSSTTYIGGGTGAAPMLGAAAAGTPWS